VSHETIYRSLFIQAAWSAKKELIGHLRSKRRLRHSRKAGTHVSCVARYRMPSPSESAPQTPKTGPFMATGG